MATSPFGELLKQFHDAVAEDDNALLERFVGGQDAAAFEALVRRHGPMVLGVCRRVLRNDADAEDAFQSTFLVLVRKAASLRLRTTIGQWLYGVAHRTALKAKQMDQGRRERDQQAARVEAGTKEDRDLAALLDGELRALPERYRTVLLLCEIEGRTIREAAALLGCPEGTIAARLSRGREKLAGRLRLRGLGLTAAAVAAFLHGSASAKVPATLAAATTAMAAGNVSLAVLKLTEEVMKGMLLSKLKWVAIVAVTACALGAAVVWAARPGADSAKKAAAVAPRQAAPKDDGWGQAIGGVRIRASVAKKVWRADETPEVWLDLDNPRGGELVVRRMPHCDIVVDGEWYVMAMPKIVAGAQAAHNGDRMERFTAVSLEGKKWVLKSAVKADPTDGRAYLGKLLRAAEDPANRLELKPGKHMIRVACGIGPLLGGKTEGPARYPISNRVEIEVGGAD
jgi:RNA polymerase sigma factor (sigma-70 family)